MKMKSLIAGLESRVSLLEQIHGWDRRKGWNQLKRSDLELFYEFGRFAQLVDLLEEMS